MKLKKKILIMAIIGIILIIIGLIIHFSNQEEFSDDGKADHRDEFTIVESNYLERNYKRYVAYGKKHNNYSDDKIITYVNIGLDKDFYSDIKETNEDDGLLMIVNKYFAIKKDYKPKTTTIGEFKAEIADVVLEDFNKMVAEAKKYQINLLPVKSYTSYEEQQALYDINVSDYGETKTLETIAKAGHSDYQTGLAIDISGNSNNFKYKKEFAWLSDHAYEYGFILRYPEGKEEITGFEYEPYHWRYVGKEAAKVIHDKNITFEEYYATYVLK